MIIEKIKKKEYWDLFLQYKINGSFLTYKEKEDLADFIENEGYTAVVENISNGAGFSLPEVICINKAFSQKKRTVFTFSKAENYVLKMITFLLGEYDYLFCDNLYSFRKAKGVKKAFCSLCSGKQLKNMYAYKVDISDYFNSVNTEKIIAMLESALKDEKTLLNCLIKMLREPYAIKDGEKTEIKKGIMAGVPVAAFMANLYLNELDRYFYKNNIPYARYSDDIIVFAPSTEELNRHINYIKSKLFELDLTVNESKEFLYNPGDKWTFLGFSYCAGVIDVCDVSVSKIKKKMKRKSNALIRWKHNKNASPERTVKAFIRYFNKKFFDTSNGNETTWCRWFFPIINTADGLSEIDEYMQECIRYIATEKRTKARFDFRYVQMKECGYVSLVNCYYKFKEKGIFHEI